MIYGIDWQFGSGKTSFATFLANKYQGENLIIWTNTKLNTVLIKNVIEYDDDNLIWALRSINYFNDIERTMYGFQTFNNNLTRWHRNKFTRHILIFDEAWAIANWRNSNAFDNNTTEYINQNRKNFSDIFIVTADWGQADKSLRRFVDWWFYSKPLLSWMPIIKDFKHVRCQKRDSDGVKVLMEEYTGFDEQGELILKQRPIDKFETIYFQPFVFNLYDDLYKNIKDPDKYKNLLTQDLIESLNKKWYLDKIPQDLRFPLIQNKNVPVLKTSQ